MQKVKIAAVIAEFNPLHKGHEYIIKSARELPEATHVLIVQSPNFAQRAEPAIMEKHVRAEAAIHAGASAVVEIPTAYATGNAEVFAKASVQIAVSFPHTSYLVFGTESPDLSIIRQIAKAQVKSKKNFERYMESHLKKGISFDKARCEVVKRLLPKIPAEVIETTMKTPNNILAIEYIKELINLKSSVIPIGIPRIQAPSATMIRGAILAQSKDKEITSALATPLSKGFHHLTSSNYDVFGATVLFSLMKNLTTETYNSNQELVNLISNCHPTSYRDLKDRAPTKRYSVSRIARLALHSALDVNKSDIKFLYKNKSLPYTKLLAIDACESELFANLCLNRRTPLIVRGNKVHPKKDKYYQAIKRIDDNAELLFEAVTGLKFPQKPIFVKRTPRKPRPPLLSKPTSKV